MKYRFIEIGLIPINELAISSQVFKGFFMNGKFRCLVAKVNSWFVRLRQALTFGRCPTFVKPLFAGGAIG
jgi:hypothetical protein